MKQAKPGVFFSFVYWVLGPFFRLVHPQRTRGRQNIPAEPVIFVANHSSMIDPFMLSLAVRRRNRAYFMAKKELFRFPLRGVLRLLGAFPVDRETGGGVSAIKTALRYLKNGQNVLMFPEGTRVSEAEQVAAKTGAIRIAMQANVPIVPV